MMKSAFQRLQPSSGPRAKTLGIGALAFVLLTAYYSYVSRVDSPVTNPLLRFIETLHGALWWELYVIIVVVLVALYSYRVQDIVSAWLLTFAWGAAVGVNLGGIGITGSMPGIGFRILWGTGLGIVSAVILGSVSYLLGVWGPKTWGIQSTGTEKR